MDIKNYIFNLLEEKKLNYEKNRKSILIKSWNKVSDYIRNNPDNLDYEKIINILTDYLSMIHDYGLLEEGDLFDLEKLYKENDIGANFDYNPMDRTLKIFGNRDFFIYLSKLFHSLVKNEDYMKKINNNKGKENVIEFSVSLKTDKKSKKRKKRLNLENIVAIQFINWKPKSDDITNIKLYSIFKIEEFQPNHVDEYDFVKFPESEVSKLWAFSIKDDNDRIIKFAASPRDDNIVFIKKKDLNQLDKD